MCCRWLARAAVGAAIIALIVPGCARWGRQPAGGASSSRGKTSIPAALSDAAALVRQGGAAAKLGQPMSVRSYPPDRMYEAIDGEADLFLAYGCKSLVVARYTVEGGIVDAELFDQRLALNAYGVFSQLRGRETPVAVGAGGVNVAGEAVLFWKSRYFVRVSTSNAKQVPAGTLERLARSIAGEVKGSSELPEWTKALPAGEGTGARTQYVARNVLGHAFLSNAMIGEYGEGTNASRLALVRSAGEEKARAQWRRLEEFYHGRAEAQGGGRSALDAFIGADAMGRPVRGVRSGRYVVVAIGGSAAQAQRLIATTLGNLARVAERSS
jgi:hypothetical protein